MPFRQIDIPSLGRRLSNVMAHPSSAEPGTHEPGLDVYHRLGGNCLHLHGEGGETHSRRMAGQWLSARRLRPEFFLCSQVCHEGWDDVARQPINRFTPGAMAEDIAGDLELLGTDHLDLIYLDARQRRPFEPVVEAIQREIARGRVRARGVRNWTADRIRAANAYAARVGGAGTAAVVTTELAPAAATGPLWPEYVPFDEPLEQVVRDLGLAVFAHASDLTLGQCLYGDEDALARLRPEWIRRWDHSRNSALVRHVRRIAAERALTPREVSVAWLLNQAFPVVAVVGLPSLMNADSTQYERASQLQLDEAEMGVLNPWRRNPAGET